MRCVNCEGQEAVRLLAAGGCTRGKEDVRMQESVLGRRLRGEGGCKCKG